MTTTKKKTKKTRATKAGSAGCLFLSDVFEAMEADLNEVLLERDEEVRSIILALLSGQHLFMLGVPGTGKSFLATELLKRVKGAQLFDLLLTRFTEPSEVFGGANIKALRDSGRTTRVPDGMLQQAHIAFLDEIWKCNSALLNSLLTLLNERLYKEGSTQFKCPLETMVSASNEMPQGDDLGALYDRIAFRHIVSPLSRGGLRELLLVPRRRTPKVTIDLATLKRAQEEVAQVKVTEATVDTMLRMGEALAGIKGVYVSDRRWQIAFRIAQASAWLAGRTETLDEDLLPLRHVLWCDPDHRATVEVAVIGTAVPALSEVRDLLDIAAELSGNFQRSDDENVRTESLMKLRATAEKANERAPRAGDAGRRIAAKISKLAKDAITLSQRRLAELYGDDGLFGDVE